MIARTQSTIMTRREQIASPPSSPEVHVTPATCTGARPTSSSADNDKKENPTTSPPAIDTSTPSSCLSMNGREALLGRVARVIDQGLAVDESNPGQAPTSTTSVVLEEEEEEEEEEASPLLADLGLSFASTNDGPATSPSYSAQLSAPTNRTPTNQRCLLPPSSTIGNPFQPRRSERHHFAVAKDMLDAFFDDDDDDDDENVEDMDDFDFDDGVGSLSQNANAA